MLPSLFISRVKIVWSLVHSCSKYSPKKGNLLYNLNFFWCSFWNSSLKRKIPLFYFLSLFFPFFALCLYLYISFSPVFALTCLLRKSRKCFFLSKKIATNNTEINLYSRKSSSFIIYFFCECILPWKILVRPVRK